MNNFKFPLTIAAAFFGFSLLATADASELVEPDQLSLISAAVVAAGQPADRLNIADYQCAEGQHIGWVTCNVEVDVTGTDGRSYIRHFSGLYVKKAI